MASINKPKLTTGFWRRGEPFVWGTAVALTLTLLSIATLLAVIVANGLGVFWPADLAQFTLDDGSHVLGEIQKYEHAPESNLERVQLKVGNRDIYQQDFRWIDLESVVSTAYPEDAVALERMEHGDFYGYLKALSGSDPQDEPLWQALLNRWAYVKEEMKAVDALREQVADISNQMSRIDRRLEKLAFDEVPSASSSVAELQSRKSALQETFSALLARQNEEAKRVAAHTAVFVDSRGAEKTIPLASIVRAYQPNTLSVPRKLWFYLSKVKELLTEGPRESNTEGGLFPAIFGTIMLTFLMSLLSFPLGLLAGIYLRLYAKDGPMVRVVRIAVNNLAGIPSIVYGIFGLGFFVYGVGGLIDQLFFPERLPTPTFGTGGILWASLTLGILTVPVVIVATEEAFGAIPKGIIEGAYALGSTKLQTLVRVLIPMASPGIMTGFILAMARAAGEVAPLMITGVVKLAPALPLDSEYPFLHLDRKFMHLGFHTYDIGFQSPNVEAAKPMVFVTAFLLVLIVLIMSSTAIYLRNYMRRKYTPGAM